jgi:hypothetical protein
MKILALDLGKSNSAVCVLDTIAMKECYTTIAGGRGRDLCVLP